MAKQGFNGTSMRDLASETGRSLSGLYHYFRSKEDLLFLINFYGFTTLNASWRKLVGMLEQPHEKLYAFIFFHMSYFVEHMDEMRVMTWGTHVLHLEKARMIQKLKDQYTNAAEEIVRELHEARGRETTDQQQLSRETYLLFGMMNWTFGWYSPRKHGKVTDLINDIFQTFVSGISGGQFEHDDMEGTRRVVSDLFHQNKTSSMWAPAMAEESET
jgi:AcrR family transcriptional regulator